MASIRYFIPEDGDTEENPNVYLAPKNQHPGRPPTLGQVISSFPLPGTYHFRFKTPIIPGADQQPNAMAVWMDFTDPHKCVGVWRNSIVAKVTRISMDDEPKNMDYGPPPAAAPAPRQQPVERAPAPVPQPRPAVNAEANLLGVFDSAPASGQPRGHSAPQSAHSGGGSGDLLGSAHHSDSGGSLLDFGNEQQQQPAGGYGDDLLGMGGGQNAHQQQQHGNNHVGGSSHGSSPFPF